MRYSPPSSASLPVQAAESTICSRSPKFVEGLKVDAFSVCIVELKKPMKLGQERWKRSVESGHGLPTITIGSGRIGTKITGT